MAEIDGATLVARCLKQQGIDELFGVVGIPVTGIALAAPGEGIRYVGMRHEQAAGAAIPSRQKSMPACCGGAALPT